MLKEMLKSIFSLKGDMAEHEVIKERLVSGGQVTGTNMCVLMLAILIASIGLNMNSTAVIIGAMLISPLMGSILSMAYGTATADSRLAEKSGLGLAFQVILCLLTSTLYFLISPISTTTSELLARTQPTIWDVLIALCGGLAGIIGMTRAEKSNVIPGVAIATALMPPLCTCGYSIANKQWQMLLGAGYLFLVNTYFIFLSALVILLILEVPKVNQMSEERVKKLKRTVIRSTIILIIPSIIIAYFMVHEENNNQNTLTGFLDTITVEEITKQAAVLFPDVESIRIGELAKVGEEDVIEKDSIILVRLNHEFQKEEQEKLEKWLQEVYEGYTIIYEEVG